MAREKKTQQIDRIVGEIGQSQVVVITDYRGIPAKELTALRRAMSKSGGKFMVVKNTLAIFAAQKAGTDDMVKMLTGPVGMVFGHGDISKTVKTVQEHIRTTGSILSVKGGMLGKRVLDKNAVMALASIPSREVLLTQVVTSLMAPLQRLHYVISSPLRGLAGVLQARAKQLETGGNKPPQAS
jgi:large subunit ribosomal protein L10